MPKEEKIALIKRLMNSPVENVVFKKNFIFLTYDGNRLKQKFVEKERHIHVGEWSRSRKEVYVSDGRLPPLDKKAIAVHEVIEKYLAQKYKLDVDKEAHKIATEKEKEWFKKMGGNWRSHELIVYWNWHRLGEH